MAKLNKFVIPAAILIVVYLVLAIAISQNRPFSLALDEGYHLEYVTFIKQHGRLPVTYQERAEITRADFPPLYQLMVAGLSANIDINDPPAFKIFGNSFRYRAMDHQVDDVLIIKTEDFRRPYFGPFLVWQIGRWLSIVLSLATVLVVFLALRETPLGQKPLAALAAAGLLAFIPRYIFLGASLNDDNLLGLFAALYFWMMVKAVNNPRQWWPFMGMGIFLGLSMTVKYTLIVVPFEVALICFLLAKNKGLGWSWAWRRIAIVAVLALLCSSWWFGWNLWFLNTVPEDGWVGGLTRPLLAGGHDTTLNRLGGLASGGQVGLIDLPEDTSIGTFTQWVRSTFLSFWGVGNIDSHPLSLVFYIAIGVMLIVAVVGLWRLWKTDPNTRMWIGLFALHITIFFILPLIRFGLTRRLSVAAQGRHILIPAAAAVVGLIVWGLTAMIPQRWQRLVFSIIVGSFIIWSGIHLYQFAAQAPSFLPLRSLPQASEWLPYRVNAQFGDSMALVTYDVDAQPENGLLHLDLAWLSLGHTNESYRVKVELKNSADEVVSYWLGYNGQGRVPTLAWEPDDVIFDRLVLPLPDMPAGEYGLELQVLSNAGPLAVITEGNSDKLQRETLALRKIILDTPAHLPLAQKMSDLPVEIAYDVWQVSEPVAAEEILTYRYPGTISVIVSDSQFDNAVLNLELVDETGQAWPATHNEANIFTFVIGPRWQSGDYRLRVTLQKGEDIIAQSTSQLHLSVENWWERHFETPEEIEVPFEANFANQLGFLGYTLPQKQVEAGESFPVTLYWQALPNKAPQADFIQFNHLLDSNGNLQGGYDRQPLEYYNTLLWAPGEVIVDGYTVPVDVDALPGEYFLDVGYYIMIGESAVNLPLVADGEMTDVTSVTIGPVEVVAP